MKRVLCAVGHYLIRPTPVGQAVRSPSYQGGAGDLHLHLQLLKGATHQRLCLFQDTHLCSLHVAETWGPNRSLGLALGGLGSWLHRCQQAAPKYAHPVPLPPASFWTIPVLEGPIHLEIKHERLVLLMFRLPSVPGSGWLAGENQASGAASCLPTSPQEDDSLSASQLSFPHSGPPPLTADQDFHLCLWIFLLTPIHNDPQGQFVLLILAF